MTLGSIGGEVNEAFLIHGALDLFRNGPPGGRSGRVAVHIPYCANSAATLIALAGDYVVIAPSAKMLIHAPTGGEDGSIANSRNVAESRMIPCYEERATIGWSRAEVAGVVTAFGNVEIDAWQAVAWGLADEVGDARRGARACAALPVLAREPHQRPSSRLEGGRMAVSEPTAIRRERLGGRRTRVRGRDRRRGARSEVAHTLARNWPCSFPSNLWSPWRGLLAARGL